MDEHKTGTTLSRRDLLDARRTARSRCEPRGAGPGRAGARSGRRRNEAPGLVVAEHGRLSEGVRHRREAVRQGRRAQLGAVQVLPVRRLLHQVQDRCCRWPRAGHARDGVVRQLPRGRRRGHAARSDPGHQDGLPAVLRDCHGADAVQEQDLRDPDGPEHADHRVQQGHLREARPDDPDDPRPSCSRWCRRSRPPGCSRCR